MKTSWPEAIKFTFEAEGYASDLKADPGGSTYLGISSHFWPEDYRAVVALAKEDRQKALKYAEDFYRYHFWTYVDGDDLSHPLDVVAFDSAVNPGPTWAHHTLAITQDWREVLTIREQHYRTTARPEFLNGLLNRCAALRTKYKEE